MKNLVNDGHEKRMIAPTGGVISGAAVLIGSLFGVANATAAAGVLFNMILKGIATLAKTAGLEISKGDLIFYNATTGLLTKTATDTPVGIATADAGADDLAAEVAYSQHMAGGGSVDISGKADIVDSGTENNFAALDADGNLKDSAKAANDFATPADLTDFVTESNVMAAIAGMYQVDIDGNNGIGNCAITVRTAGVAPAAGDKLIFGTAFESAGMTATQPAVLGTDFEVELVDDAGTIKVEQLSSSDLSANQYSFLVLAI